ncbi:hypothetical protein SBADM41S_00788 [Streptomyces badius]
MLAGTAPPSGPPCSPLLQDTAGRQLLAWPVAADLLRRRAASTRRWRSAPAGWPSPCWTRAPRSPCPWSPRSPPWRSSRRLRRRGRGRRLGAVPGLALQGRRHLDQGGPAAPAGRLSPRTSAPTPCPPLPERHDRRGPDGQRGDGQLPPPGRRSASARWSTTRCWPPTARPMCMCCPRSRSRSRSRCWRRCRSAPRSSSPAPAARPPMWRGRARAGHRQPGRRGRGQRPQGRRRDPGTAGARSRRAGGQGRLGAGQRTVHHRGRHRHPPADLRGRGPPEARVSG